ncbi:MAG: hypothetical protein V7L11_17660 [Nostoc sp.]|uniref:hypothetical protein n=1 Tax=Nostoc sp. TaxID=1180 RepID=UPI002FFBC783
MGYFGNPITSSLNNAFNGVSGVAKKAFNAQLQADIEAANAVKNISTQAYQAYKNATTFDISYDRCNIIITTALGVVHYRNPDCSIPYPVTGNPSHNSNTFFACNDGTYYKIITTRDTTYSFFVNGSLTSITYPSGTDFSDITNAQKASSLYLLNKELDSKTKLSNDFRGVTYTTLQTGSSIGGTDLTVKKYNNDGTPGQSLSSSNVSTSIWVFLMTWERNYGGTWVAESGRYTGWVQADYVQAPCPLYKQSPPPPNIQPKECECMCNDNLLRLVLQRIGNLPATVPTNIADSTNTTTQTLQSIAEMIFWHVKQMDAISGQYPIPLTIKADPNVSGSKDTNLELPNIAETLAEILGLLIATKRDSHAGLVAGISALTEAGMIKNLATQTFDIAHANAEYLGYKLEQQKRTIPSAFTPNAKTITETLRPTNVDIVSYVNNDKVDLQDEIKKLTTMAERWNAQNWRSLGTSATAAIAGLQKNFIDSPQAVTNVSNAVKEESFQQFLNEVQQGFTATPGVADKVDPWGDSPLDAPIVKEVGIIDPNAPPLPSTATPQQIKATNNSKTVANIANLLSKL